MDQGLLGGKERIELDFDAQGGHRVELAGDEGLGRAREPRDDVGDAGSGWVSVRVHGRSVTYAQKHMEGPKKIRVVILIDSLLNPGGGETLAVENALRLDPERFTRTLVVTRWDERLRSIEPAASMLASLEAAGVRILPLKRTSKLSLGAWRPLVSLLRRERTDVIHGHMFGSNVWASILGTLTGVPAVVAHEHMWSYDGGRARALVDRLLIGRLSDAFIAVSSTGERLMIEREGIRPSDIVTIPNGIDAVASDAGPNVRKELGIPADASVIGTVGHLREEKAHEVLIEAAARLSPAHPGLRVLIAGEGERRPVLEALIEARGLGDVVTLLGSRTDVPDLLAAFDVAVCCSDFEGGPLSVMEYMGAGLPVVASDVGGLPELVREGETGRLVPPRDPGALAAAADDLLSDPGRAREMGAAGRELQRREYDIDAWARRLEGLYENLLVD